MKCTTYRLSLKRKRFPRKRFSTFAPVPSSSENMQLIAKTMFGMEPLLMDELKVLGATEIVPLTRAVSFQGDLKLLYQANLHLRTALRILLPIYQFSARNTEELYRKIGAYDWSQHLSNDKTFAINSSVSSSFFNHSQYVSLKSKDAIVDQFRENTGKRPSIDLENPDIRLNIHVTESNISVSLDASGDSLHKRGYRITGHQAPLNEVLAAGLVKLSGWSPDQPLIDPMCGSGTLLFEAAMMASHIPPNLNRSSFGFMNWPNFDEALWNEVVEEARTAITQPALNMQGSDVSPKSIYLSETIAGNLGLADRISFERKSFQRLPLTYDSGMVIMNPPYGIRMEEEDLAGLYKMIGDRLKAAYAGFDAWILSANNTALKYIGLHPSRKITVFNGSIECKFQKFSLYKGSRKAGKN